MPATLDLLHVRHDHRADGPAAHADDIAVTTATTPDRVLSALDGHDAVLCEYDLEEGTGLDALERVRERDPDLPVVLCTDEPDGRVAAAATRRGVTEYVPRSETDPLERVRSVVERSRETGTNPLPADLSTSFDAIAGSIADAIVTIDADSRIVYANDYLSDLTGYDRSALVGQPFTKLIPEHLRADHEAGVARYLETGEKSLDWEYLELPMVDADGETLTVSVSFGDFRLDGQWFCTGVVRNISERKAREERLAESNRRLDLVLEGTDTGVYEWDLGTGEVEWDEATAALFDTTPEAFEGTVEAFHDYVHPDDRESLEDALAEAREGDAGFDAEFRTVVDGETRWLRTEGVVEEQEAQAPRLIAIATDITERKARERELTVVKERLELAATNAGLGVWDWHVPTGDLEFSDQWARMLGYEPGELDNDLSTWKALAHPEDQERVMTAVERHFAGETTTLDTEYRLRTADGDYRWVRGTGRVTEWDDGDPVRFVGVNQDISEQKEREAEIRAARDRVERVLERVGDAFFAVDDDWRLTYVNERGGAVLRGAMGRDLAAEEMVGLHLWEEIPEAVGTTFYEKYNEAMETQERVTFEEHYPPLGQWFRVNAYPAEDGLSVYFHDITEQKERDRKLSSLHETTRSLMGARTPEEVARTVATAAEYQLGYELALVRLHDPEAGTLDPVFGTEALPDRPVYDADEAFPGEAFQSGEPVVVESFDRVENYQSERAEAAMYIPVGDHGVLSVASTEVESFDDGDVAIAEILAANAAAALDRVDRDEALLRYETVVENVRDMVYVLDEEGRFQLVTEPLADWLGYEREAMLGERPTQVLDTATVDRFEDEIEALRAGTAEAASLEVSLRTAGGETRPAEVEVSLVDDDRFQGTVGVVRDRTELKRTKAQLRDERDRFSYLFNNLPDPVVEVTLTDAGPQVESVNPAFESVFGRESDELTDRTLGEVLSSPEGDDAGTPLAEVRRGETVQVEIRRQAADGARDFLFRGVPYSDEGEAVRAFGIYTDITEQRERERRLEVLNRVLRHNLRNDMTVVLGLADELSDRLDDDDPNQALLDRLCGRAGEVVEVSDRARDIQQSVGRRESGTGPVDVSKVVQEVAATVRQRTAGRVSTTVPETPLRAGDGRLRSVLEELLANAVEHAGEEPAVDVAVRADGETVTVTVADDGPGIPAHERAVLTGDEVITQLSHGSGLGLWLVVWIVESYGGTVEFGASQDGGAAVTVRLPRA